MKTTYINLISGPGVGKSTIAAGIFHEFKINGISCEFVQEVAKDLVWSENYKDLENQVYILGKQHRSLKILDGKVDYVITDTSLLCSIVYNKTNTNKYFDDFIVEEFKSFNNYNIFIDRKVKYDESGRYQSEAEAILVDEQFKKVIRDYNLNIDCYFDISGDYNQNIKNLVQTIKNKQ